jgi:hypothetical protein
MRGLLLALTGLFIAAAAAPGQGAGIDKGTFEIGAFGRYNRPSGAFTVTDVKNDRFGFGERVGLFVATNLALELDASSNALELAPGQPQAGCNLPSTPCPLQYRPIHLDLVYNAPVSRRVFFLVGAGVSDQRLSKSIENSNLGVGGTAGFRWRASTGLSFRLDGILDILPKGTLDVMNTYAAGDIGVDVLLGGHRCDHSADMIDIRPTLASLQSGRAQTFSAAAMYCGAPDAAVFSLTGPGMLDSLTGLYTATDPGAAKVVARSRRSRLTAVADVTVTAPVRATTPPPAQPSRVASLAIVGPARVKARIPSQYAAEPRLADGTAVARPVRWSVISGAGAVDTSGMLVTTGPGVVVLQARSENVTTTDSVTSYDWVPFHTASVVGVSLESVRPVINQAGHSQYPNLVLGCGTGTFVLGLVTDDLFLGGGALKFSFDEAPAISETWLPNLRSVTYFGGGNGARKLLAARIAGSRHYVVTFAEASAGTHEADFAVAEMADAVAPLLAACPSDGPRRPLANTADSSAAIVALLSTWRQVLQH